MSGQSITADLLADAAEAIIAEQFGAENWILRKFRLDFRTAATLMDRLEQLGVVGPSKGAAPRDVLVSVGLAGWAAEEIRNGRSVR